MKRVDTGCLRTGPEGLTSEATIMNVKHLAQGRDASAALSDGDKTA